MPLAAVLLATIPVADSINLALRFRVDIPAPISAVWSAWTDSNSVRQWLAPGCNIELRPFGRYEILFSPEAPAGQRGAEHNVVLAVQAPELLSFTWDAPPSLPEARKQRTTVVIRLRALSENRTRVWFEQTGWGRGGEWDQSRQYFTSAWKLVLSLLHYRFAVGPLNGKADPSEAVLAEHAGAVSGW